jgi:hypothetical protein
MPQLVHKNKVPALHINDIERHFFLEAFAIPILMFYLIHLRFMELSSIRLTVYYEQMLPFFQSNTVQN